MKSANRDRMLIEATGMTIVEYAKDSLRKELYFSEAYAQDLMTPDEREAYSEYKANRLYEALKDCPF